MGHPIPPKTNSVALAAEITDHEAIVTALRSGGLPAYMATIILDRLIAARGAPTAQRIREEDKAAWLRQDWL